MPLTETYESPAIAPGSKSWLWLHLNLADHRCESWLSSKLGLPKGVASAFCERAGRQFVAVRESYSYGHISDFRREFDSDSTEHAWCHFVLGGNLLLTARLKAVQSAERIRREIARGQRFSDPAGLLILLISNYPDTLDAVLHRLMDELEIVEDHILDDRHRGERKRLMIVRRETARLHRHMRAQRRALHLAERTIPDLPAGIVPIITRLANLDQDFEALESRARFFHDEIDAKLAAETNRQLYILSALTAAFLPPALVAGLFGMNFPGLPWSNSAYGFWIALMLCIASSAAVWLFLWRVNRS